VADSGHHLFWKCSSWRCKVYDIECVYAIWKRQKEQFVARNHFSMWQNPKGKFSRHEVITVISLQLWPSWISFLDTPVFARWLLNGHCVISAQETYNNKNNKYCRINMGWHILKIITTLRHVGRSVRCIRIVPISSRSVAIEENCNYKSCLF